MRYFILILALISTLSALNWPNDYEKALAQAKKEKKDIYLFLGSEYCKYCDKFKEEVLAKDEVLQKLKKSYVLLYLSRDIDDIPAGLEVKPVPRHYFLDSNGKIIYTTIGGRSVKGFYELLDEVKEAKEFKEKR
ncbi:MAG: thioredoxin family protein [Sulfurimonas sp.]|uniref:thioredoxin family protein n=1 Tax=Sulfurimonas sp. TaxID=2022749 RepID=UPI002620DCB0|nr:thioredoxin family protein [Sulfurimonas sp.]MDD5401545.1 thioredoxin family protein [Sulfurimonas sp.]